MSQSPILKQNILFNEEIIASKSHIKILASKNHRPKFVEIWYYIFYSLDLFKSCFLTVV